VGKMGGIMIGQREKMVKDAVERKEQDKEVLKLQWGKGMKRQNKFFLIV
jgi:hypothetical protein